MLAGLTKVDISDAPELFAHALKDLGLPLLTRLAAARVYSIAISRQILKGEISPRDGANKIWDAVVLAVTDSHDLDPFIYAASELESRPEDRDFFEAAILKEAALWAAKTDELPQSAS